MRARDVWTVYRKELRETLRDRRTLGFMILLPLIVYPVMMVGASEWLISHEVNRRATASRVALVGALDEAGPIVAALEARAGEVQVERRPGPFVPPAPGSGSAPLGEAKVVVEVPAGFAARLAAGEPAPIRVYYDAADDASDLAKSRVVRALEEFSAAEARKRLGERGLEARLLEPLALSSVNLATRAKVGRTELARILPFFIVLMSLLGAFYPAIDLTAGEKERGTLEPLLATPTPRHAIVGGKFLTVATVSALTALLNVICMGGAALWIARSAARAHGGGAVTGPGGTSFDVGVVLAAVPWGAVGLALVGLVGSTLLFSGIVIAIASLARNFKEAQNFLTPVHMVLTVPAMASFMPGTGLDYGTALVPVANVAFLLKAAIAGTLSVGPGVVALLAIVAYAVAAASFAARIYDSDRLLFSPEEGPGRALRQILADLLFLRRRTTPHEAGVAGDPGARPRAAGAADGPDAFSGRAAAEALTPGTALALFAAVAVLLFTVGPEWQARGTGGIAVSQWLLVALPTVLVARAAGAGGARRLLALGRPRSRHVIAAILIGTTAWFLLAWLVVPLQERIAPTPEPLRRTLEEMAAPRDVPAPLLILAVAVTPAICEELLMRGAVLRALRGTLGGPGAVFVSSFLFGILHLSLYRFVPTFLLGIALGVVTLAARSLYPAMIVHALNNAAVILLALPVGRPAGAWLEAHAAWAGTAALLLCAAGFGLLLRDLRR